MSCIIYGRYQLEFTKVCSRIFCLFTNSILCLKFLLKLLCGTHFSTRWGQIGSLAYFSMRVPAIAQGSLPSE